ncbi:hypothetical protein [Desulfosporosinus youngiae]|uniref:Uncharacterized protein n=1 Tax=Desulfosporosinus youngiae DSM 17734 TaxID=768710 RepID=H5Y3W8_9FIRM|nr:hypothetical protein [Desulfosporosinus youngiae]EHQ89506.1 hypothetical protein DesyoDRAFT_2431 [Desulfosporosinus youngiae DSM 17734]
MIITRTHLTGFAVGVGVCAVGYYLYKKNEDKVDQLLRNQGIDIPVSAKKDYNSMTLEELVAQKERIEDLIAEKEMIKDQLAVSTPIE